MTKTLILTLQFLLLFASNSFIQAQCNPITPPYLQDFNNIDLDEECWLLGSSGTPETGPNISNWAGWVEGGFANIGEEGAMNLNLNTSYAGDEKWLISPYFEITAINLQVDFDFAITKNDDIIAGQLDLDDEIHLLITDDEGETWNSLKIWTDEDTVNPLGEWISHDLSTYVGLTIQFAIWSTRGTEEEYVFNDIFVDNFQVRTPPTCPLVSAAQAIGITGETAKFTWVDNVIGGEGDIEFGEAGFTPTGQPNFGYNNVSSPKTLTGLTELTDYDVYIRADCGAGADNLSDWIGPITFTTSCATIQEDYLQSFFSFPPDCWTLGEEGTPDTKPVYIVDDNRWYKSDFGNVGPSKAASMTLWALGVEDWLISPYFYIAPGGFYQARFDFSITANNSSNSTTLGSDDEVHFLITTDFGDTWTSLQSWTNEDNVNPAGELKIYDLNPYIGTRVQFAFWATEGALNNAADNDVFIDNFEVKSLFDLLTITENSTSDVLCNGVGNGAIDVSVSGGVAPYTFNWSNGATTEDVSDLDPGEYFLTLTDVNGTSLTSEAIIIELETELEVIETIIQETGLDANDGNIELEVNGATGDLTFNWSNGETTTSISGLTEGEYCCTITDALGCTIENCYEIEDGISSIVTIDDLVDFNVSPNPILHDDLHISLQFSQAKNLDIKVVNTLGKQIYFSEEKTVLNFNQTINMAQVTSGLYFVHIYSVEDNQHIVQRVVKL